MEKKMEKRGGWMEIWDHDNMVCTRGCMVCNSVTARAGGGMAESACQCGGTHGIQTHEPRARAACSTPLPSHLHPVRFLGVLCEIAIFCQSLSSFQFDFQKRHSLPQAATPRTHDTHTHTNAHPNEESGFPRPRDPATHEAGQRTRHGEGVGGGEWLRGRRANGGREGGIGTHSVAATGGPRKKATSSQNPVGAARPFSMHNRGESAPIVLVPSWYSYAMRAPR